MSSSIRQSNLFSAENYKKIFKAYSFIDYTAYDFDTLKQALINYIQTYYPEDYNDYIESSEFIAIIELIAYLGTSLAFRTDLNSRENFIDTAERRESIIRLAQMVNYVPRRNIPASGLFKIESVQTNQPLTDANGVNINDLAIFWNDPNNPDWFDQFVQVCNASFSTLNPFGRPTKSGMIGSIPTDLYQLTSVIRQSIAYPTTISVNGQQYPVDICNPDFVTNQTIFERDPNPSNAFNFIYRNDSLGVASVNTGFFLYFKQGNLLNIDTNFEFPSPNRLYPIDIQNINQDDVYVQETDQQGNVINQWVKVPALSGENIIYNSIQYGERNIFDVISGAGDTITIRFADGNFGNVPTGLFRTWVRVSANQNLVIRPNDAQGMQLTIPYIGYDKQQYSLNITFSLEQTIGNASAAETNEQIKLRAPEVFSTQSRMVNGSDYNVLPLVYGNQIAKIQSINRTYSGQSRYIDLNDPTGFHKDLLIFGQDGALYRDNQNVLSEIVRDASNTHNIHSILINNIQEILRDPKVSTFFYDEYIPQFEATIRVNPPLTGYSILDLSNPHSNQLLWRTSPAKFKNDTGYFSSIVNGDASTAEPLTNTFTVDNIDVGTYQSFGFITAGSILSFQQPSIPSPHACSVNTVIQNGIPVIINPLNPYANIGPVGLGAEIQNNASAAKVYPAFRSSLTATEISEISQRISEGISFWLYYDLLQNAWHTSTTTISGVSDMSQVPFVYALPMPSENFPPEIKQIYSNWGIYPDSGLVYINIASNNQIATTTYDITARGRVYIFESYRDVRFYWEPGRVVIDSASGLALQDTIEIMPFVNTNNTINNNEPVITDPSTAFLKTSVNFNISGVFIQDDGFQDPARVKVSLVDGNNDGIPDDPGGFDSIVTLQDRVVFEYYTNEISGYQSTRPWIAKWGLDLENWAGDIYTYFPVATNSTDPGTWTTLYGPPYIANMDLWSLYTSGPGPHTDYGYLQFIADPAIIASTNTTNTTFVYQYLSDADLIFIGNPLTLPFDNSDPATNTLSNQLSAFLNNVHAFDWIVGTDLINKYTVLQAYFTNKSFLLANTPPGFGIYNLFELQSTQNSEYGLTNYIVVSSVDKYHFDKNGKVFTQNTTVAEPIPLYFKWSHYSPIDQRVDPSASNIIDMIVITDGYYTDVTNWKNNNGTLVTLPVPPTTEELRIQFQNLDQYKMVSDSMIWNSGEFKLLFGEQAATELQATFKIVKALSTSISDNEVKTQVIRAINVYFDIRNWDFGETFFYTELAAFIHQQLSKTISSVVIVPTNSSSQFGNLFEIVAGPNQLFMSTATVNNVQIVSNLTDQNLRV